MSTRTPRTTLNSSQCVYQINTHLLYEIKWMLFAATEYKRLADSGDNRHYQALIDSAMTHARNLFEFTEKSSDTSFTMGAIGGTPCRKERWTGYLNNRVSHMYDREWEKTSWPDGIDNGSNDKLVKMANIVLRLLEAQGTALKDSAVQGAYDTLLAAAKAYLSDPTDDLFDALGGLYDDSLDGRPY